MRYVELVTVEKGTVETLREQVGRHRNLLLRCRKELREHDCEHKHVTDPELVRELMAVELEECHEQAQAT